MSVDKKTTFTQDTEDEVLDEVAETDLKPKKLRSKQKKSSSTKHKVQEEKPIVKEKQSKCTDCKKEFGLFRWRYKCDFCEHTICDDCVVSKIYHLKDKASHLAHDCEDTSGRLLFRLLSYHPEQSGSYCLNCSTLFLKPLIEKYDAAVVKANLMEAYSSRYRGRIPIDSKHDLVQIITPWFREKADAELAIKVEAAFKGFDLVIEQNLEKDTDSEEGTGNGTYYFAIWRATGKAAKKA